MWAQQKIPAAPSRAADYVEIQQLVARYAYAVDTHADNGNAYAELFAQGRRVRRQDDRAARPSPSWR